MQAFSPAVRDIFEHFDFNTQIERLNKSGLLYLVVEKFAHIDLLHILEQREHPFWTNVNSDSD
jgi:type I restriction-modification system DNA methylase subunit